MLKKHSFLGELLLFDTTPRSMGNHPDCLLVPALTGRQTSQASHLHHCVLAISRSIIIGCFPLRTCPPQTGCTPAFPLGSLDAIFFTDSNFCRSVIAPRLRLRKQLTYLDDRIWLVVNIFHPAFVNVH